MLENLVIVESPAKAKTIEKFLGKNYKVCSSYGHIRDLEKKGLGIDIENGFSPSYEISADKKNLVSELTKMTKEAENIWLASDEDREGEAIAWHLAQVLNLPVEQTKRIVFHEITKNAILKAIESPRTIDMNLVNAQQARRVLDRLVGFELSPVLWKKVKPALSAGRVQSVAVRLIVEREREIIAFQSSNYYRITAQFYRTDDASKTLFKAVLDHQFATKEEALAYLEGCKDATWKVTNSETKPSQKLPAAPFTTSTLQQEAGRKLGLSVSQTMSIAQKLYENGHITYMRTDSVNLATQALAAAKAEIIKEFGEEYSAWRTYKTKSKGAQEAHEAIRPTYIEKHTIEGTATEKKLYDLIWKRTVASQMAAAKTEKTTITISDGKRKEQFVVMGEVIVFDGFIKLYTESVDDENENEGGGILPHMSVGETLTSTTIEATERFTQPPYRYSEATLVKKLEELGIGRPSTYAPTITTIINRDYVQKQNREAVKRNYTQITLKGGKLNEKTLSENVGKEKNKLFPTDIGIIVNDYLESQFKAIMDYNFTATVEKEFDEIAEGKKEWTAMISDFYSPFHDTVETALETQNRQINQARILGVDPVSGHQVSARIGRYGPMVQIDGAEGEKPRYAAMKKGQLIPTITLEEALELFSLPRTLGEYEEKEIVAGIGKFGPYLRWNGKFISLPKTEDPHTVTLETATELIIQKTEQDKKAKEPIKKFDADPEVVILNGMYGPYIQYKGKNYRIPKSKDPQALSLEDCMALISKSKK
ncbi:MAG: type I DNA topoisomerase [Tidjanibacter sp.]|nr:type I DNA topoisomerase [Tidjanibacter sp.]